MDLRTSVGPHKQYPYLRSLGCPDCGGTCGSTPKNLSGFGTQGFGTQGFGPQLVVNNRTPLKSTRVRISGGDRGISQTIRYMYGVVMGDEGVSSAEIRRTAIQIVQGVPSRDQQGELTAVLNWVKSNIRFRGEYKETVQTPLVTLQLRAGDCDDHSTLIASLLGSLGFKTRFRTVAADPSAPYAFSHVFTEVFQRKTGKWVSLDSTVPQSTVGWQPPRVYRSQAWRSMGSLGDDNTTTPDPAANGQIPGLSPKGQAIFQIANTFSNALASRLQFGGNPPRPKDLNIGINSSTVGGISPTLVILGGGALALAAIVGLSRRPR